MKRFFIYIFLLCGILFSLKASAVVEKRSIAVFTLDVPMSSSSYAIYSNTQNMFASDLVNSLQRYKDINVIDIHTSQKLVENAGLTRKYEKMVKEYKQKYTLDYEKVDDIARAIGADYIAFVYGGFDMEKSFLKWNWKHRCQWIWASPIKSSAKLVINTTLVDVMKHNYILEENLDKDIPMDNFSTPAQSFGENIVPVAQIKKFTKPKAREIAHNIHNAIYPNLKSKYSEKETFVERYIPDGNNQVPIEDYSSTDSSGSPDMTNEVVEIRKQNFKSWIQENL